MNKKKNYIIISAVFILQLLNSCSNQKKDIYIQLEDLDKYPYIFNEDSIENSNIVEVNQTGRFWYKSWELHYNFDKRTTRDIGVFTQDIVSQLWLKNNLCFYQLGFDYNKKKNYNFYLINYCKGGVYSIYPIEDIKYIIDKDPIIIK